MEELERDGLRRIVLADGNRVPVEILKELGRNPLELLLRAGERVLRVTVGQRDEGEAFPVRLNGRLFHARLTLYEEVRPAQEKEQAKGPVVVTAPMAGRIASLKIGLGGLAEEGQALVVLEAMKMENEVASPKKGIVKEIYVQAGALVRPGDKLALVD